MAWLAVDKNGEEWVFINKPIRKNDFYTSEDYDKCLLLPPGGIYCLIKNELTWEDEPVEI